VEVRLAVKGEAHHQEREAKVEVHLAEARQVQVAVEPPSPYPSPERPREARRLRPPMVVAVGRQRPSLRARCSQAVVQEEEHAIKCMGVGKLRHVPVRRETRLADTFVSRTYGSGYPGTSGRGVFNHGFPFYFWPIIWGGTAGGANGAYLHDSEVRQDHS
jgi:hypothetical protein